MTTWYEKYIEEPLKDLVKLLRNNGFNTVCSCGHLPKPYIQMNWDRVVQIEGLNELLVNNGYHSFIIRGIIDSKNKRIIELTFVPDLYLAKLSQIKKDKV